MFAGAGFLLPGDELDWVAPINWMHPLNKGLVAEWASFNDGGLRLRDLTGNGNNGTLTNGPTWSGSLGRPGGYGAITFDGTNDYIDCGAASPLDIGTTDLSASVWIRVANGYAPTVAGIIGKTLAAGTAGRWAILWDTPTGKVYGLSHLGTSTETAGVAGVNDGKWHHLLLVLDRGNGNGLMSLYVDGNLATSSAITGNVGTNYTITNNLRLGCYDNSSSVAANFMTGQLDAPKKWSRVLSSADAKSLFAEELQGNQNRWNWLRPRIGYAAGPAVGIAYDAVSNSDAQIAQSTYSWNHTWSGSNRFIRVDVALLTVPGTTVTALTYNGVSLNFIGKQTSAVSGAGAVECWGATAGQLAGLAAGTYSISVTLSASINSVGEAVSYTGVHQTSPTEGFNGNGATNGIGFGADATVDIASIADNTWICAALATTAVAPTANQTARNSVTNINTGANEDFGPQTPAGSKTMSYTNIGGTATWVIAGYAMRPVAASAPFVYFGFDLAHTELHQNMVSF